MATANQLQLAAERKPLRVIADEADQLKARIEDDQAYIDQCGSAAHTIDALAFQQAVMRDLAELAKLIGNLARHAEAAKYDFVVG